MSSLLALASRFTYNEDHRVIVCRDCATCLSPKEAGRESHLRGKSHRMVGQLLQTTLTKLRQYSVRTEDELIQASKDNKFGEQAAIAGLAVYTGYLCTYENCGFSTRRLLTLRHDHLPKHRRDVHIEGNVMTQVGWRECKLQTYFTAKGRIRYFPVKQDEGRGDGEDGVGDDQGGYGDEGNHHGCSSLDGCTEESRQGSKDILSYAMESREVVEDEIYTKIDNDIVQAEQDAKARARVEMESSEKLRSARIPWLVNIGFPAHLKGLSDEEILTSYMLPSKKLIEDKLNQNHDDDDDDDDEDTMEEEDDDVERSVKMKRGGQINYDLAQILVATDAMLSEAYELCGDTSAGRKMTQQRANILNEFYAGASGKSPGFRYFKHPSTLRTYFTRMKQLLVYFYRVVYRKDGHFTRNRRGIGHDSEALLLPGEVIEPTEAQMQAMDEVVEVVHRLKAVNGSATATATTVAADTETLAQTELALELKRSIRRFYMTLVCHHIGVRPFRSPVLSFCAMRARRVFDNARQMGGRRWAAEQGREDEVRMETVSNSTRTMIQGIWEDPGNYNTNLSALTWTAQLILYDQVCSQAGDDDRTVSGALEKICREFFQNKAETPFGYILQWRLYLFAVSKNTVTKRQAHWSPDGQAIHYEGVELWMSQISDLVTSEYHHARSILYDELMFGATQLPLIESSKVYDDLDTETVGDSWLTDRRNEALLGGTHRALLRYILATPQLRGVFLRGKDWGSNESRDGGKGLCQTAVEMYESYVQEFLRALPPLVQVSCPPLRAPELLSVTLCNTSRPRHLFVWHGYVLLYVRYHKGQEQSGRCKDNLRFLPRPVGDLLLTFLAYVQPLRQAFLCQRQPGATLSPCLWSHLDGTVWKDERVSDCLRKACLRAEVPQFQTAWWRQVAASITNEKFAPKERANFDQEDMTGREELHDEEELVHLAEMSNHSLHTLNHYYAGSTKLTMTTLLHRSYRASKSWHRLFHLDQSLLTRKRPLRYDGSGDEQQHEGTKGQTPQTLQAREQQAREQQPQPPKRQKQQAFQDRYAEDAVGQQQQQQQQYLGHLEQQTWQQQELGQGGVVRASTKLPQVLINCQRARFVPQNEGHPEAHLLSIARDLYHDPHLQFRLPGQQRAMMAVLGPRPAEQVVVVLATGSGKTLVVMVGAVLNREAGMSTMLILPTVALRGNMMTRLAEVGIRSCVWKPGSASASDGQLCELIIITAEAACTQAFLEYAHKLVDRRQLAQIVIDECHLTITASDYRRSMRDLAWYVRQVRARSIWLTATLPPILQDSFVTHNKLVRPQVVRESTNRPNIRYIIQTGQGSVIDRAAHLVRSRCECFPELFQQSHRDKIIIYCQTKDAVARLANLLGCPAYTADLGSEEEKSAAIAQWLSPGNVAIVATSALGPGFDHSRVRLVIHVGPPQRLTDYSQESGRAGRDGQEAASIIILGEAWGRGLGQELEPDKQAMQLYLSQHCCLRSILSHFLDTEPYWRSCTEGEDMLCIFCRRKEGSPGAKGIPNISPDHYSRLYTPDLSIVATTRTSAPVIESFTMEAGAQESTQPMQSPYFTGPGEVLRQDRLQDEVIDRYLRDLDIMRGCCLYCRVMARPFDHRSGACPRRFDWIHAKSRVLKICKNTGREWVKKKYVVCWTCYQPQVICRTADPEAEDETICRFPDMVMPLCYGIYCRAGGIAWLQRHFGVFFETVSEYMLWLGEIASIGGNECIQANCVVMLALDELQ